MYIFPFIVVFTSTLYAPSDSDIGWHLKYGEYFFKHFSILRENTFSAQMPGYPWVNSSWATDLVTYALFHQFGFFGISILGALVITATFYFFSKAAHLTFWEKAILFPVILYLEGPFFEVSFRGQLITLLAISILYFTLSQFEKGKRRVLWYAVPLFTLWSNFHGQFILGLGLFFLWTVFYLFQKWKSMTIQKERQEVYSEGKYLFFILFASFWATLIHPFGIGIYEEALRHFNNPLQKYIIEWLPLDLFSPLWWNLVFWEGLLLVTIWLLHRLKKSLSNLHYSGPALILLFLSFTVRRYFWSTIFVSIPVVRLFISRLEPKQKTVSFVLAGIVLFSTYVYTVFVKAPMQNIWRMDWDRYCYHYVGCSPKAAEFLQKQKLPGKLMTFYNWGGWLISRYPDIKPSIDGRMHLWRDKNGYSAFAEYYFIEQNIEDVDASSYDVVFMTPNKPVHRRLLELVKEKKWKIVYQDEFASIFSRIEKNGKVE